MSFFKRGNHDRNCGAGEYLQNCCFQSVKIHIDKRNHRVVCARLRPIALECPIQKQTCYRVWIVYMVISKQIAVVPSSDFLKILSVFLTESGNFIFCESNYRKPAGLDSAWNTDENYFKADCVFNFLIGRIPVRNASWIYFVGSVPLNIPRRKLM